MTAVSGQLGSAANPVPRRAARVMLVDERDRVLLFRGFDPANPKRRYWFLTGGGLDAGESSRDAAVRELREETGIVVRPERVIGPVWRDQTDFPYDGRWFRNEQDYYVVRADRPAISIEGFDEEERRSIDDLRWWSASELDATTELVYPPELAGLLRDVLARPGEG